MAVVRRNMLANVAAAVPAGTDTPAASLFFPAWLPGGRLLAGRVGPLRGRDADRAHGAGARRGPPKVGRDPH